MKPDLALIEWQITMLKYIKTLNRTADDPFTDIDAKLYPLEKVHFDELGLETLSHSAQERALKEINRVKGIQAIPQYKRIQRITGEWEDKPDILPISHKIMVRNYEDINSGIKILEAERLGSITIHIEFEVGSETISLIVNDKRVEENLKSWAGCVLSAMREGHGQTNSHELIERMEKDISPTSNFISKVVRTLNNKTEKLTGVQKLLIGGTSHIKFNENDYVIILHI